MVPSIFLTWCYRSGISYLGRGMGFFCSLFWLQFDCNILELRRTVNTLVKFERLSQNDVPYSVRLTVYSKSMERGRQIGHLCSFLKFYFPNEFPNCTNVCLHPLWLVTDLGKSWISLFSSGFRVDFVRSIKIPLPKHFHLQ